MTPDVPSKSPSGASASQFALLVTCRSHALERLQEILADALKGAADDFLDVATRTVDPELRKHYLHAVEQARTQDAGFASGVAEAYRKRAAALSGENARAESAQTSYDAGSLTLVQTGVLENEIAIGNLTTRLKDKGGEELQQFTLRVSTILGNPELLDTDNPVGPSPLACGVFGGLETLGLHEQAVRPFSALVADRVGQHIGDLYHDLNQLLAGRGVQGKARTRILKSKDTGVKSAKRDAPPVELPSGDVFAQMAALLAQQQGMPGGQPGAGMPAGTATSGGVPMMATPATVDWLNQVQRGAEAAGFTAPAGSESLNVLHALRTSETGQRFDSADAMTTQLVAMMFDHVFSDPRLPEAFKPLVAQLQVPTLKAAMLDRDFFNDEQHPARRMLDKLGSATVGWRGTADASDPLYGAVERVVQQAVQGFGTDLAELEALTGEVEQVASLEEARTDAVAQRSIDVVMRLERVEEAQQTARSTVEQRLTQTVVPPQVRALAERIYRSVLASAHESGGADCAQWTAALETLDNLLWSVKPKSGAEERARLVKTLPGLIKALDAGMEIAGFDDDERKDALNTLAPLHAAAVRGTATPAAAVPEAAAPAEEDPLDEPEGEPEFKSETLTGEDIVVETVAAAPRRGRKAHGFRGEHARMDKGTWVEFKQPDGTSLRARLSWVSPLKGMHVFVNPDSSRTLAFDPEALDAALARGDAEVLSSTAVVAEAMGYVMADLQHQGSATVH